MSQQLNADESVGNESNGKRRRRWLRFSLSTLLLLTAIAAAGFAWIGREVSRVRAEENALKAIANVIGSGQLNVLYGDRFKQEGDMFMADFGPENTGLRRRIELTFGVDPFRTVKSITIYGVGNGFSYGKDDQGRMTIDATYVAGLRDQDVHLLDSFPYLQFLMLEANPIGDKGAAEIAKLKYIETLILGNTAITEVGVRTIAGLPNLRHLNIGYTIVSDDALTSLADTSLETLEICSTNISDEAIEKFEKRHPNCEL